MTTDRWAPYVGAVEETLSGRVNFAQLIKVYRATAEGERRYSPAECVEVVPIERLGWPVGLDVDDVQADEIWGFVGCKEKNAKRSDHGDAWAFVGIERLAFFS